MKLYSLTKVMFLVKDVFPQMKVVDSFDDDTLRIQYSIPYGMQIITVGLDEYNEALARYDADHLLFETINEIAEQALYDQYIP